MWKTNKSEDIKELVLSLPDDSPYLQELRRAFLPHTKVLLPSDRIALSLRDPAFEYHFAAAYDRAGKTLPAQVISASIWRVYCHLRYPEAKSRSDPVGCEALSIAHPANRTVQALLKGLACSGLDYEEVANRSRIPLEVTTVYLNWFFDYIERKDNAVLTASILNPKTELSVAKSTEAQDPVWLAIQAGHKQGPDAVIRLLRLNTRRSGVGNGNQMANIKHVLLSSAEMKAELGMLDARDPDFLYFKGLSIVEAKQQSPFESEDDRMGFGRISADQSCQAIIKQVTQAAAAEKLRWAQEYDARDAAAVEAKRRAAEGTAAGTNNSV